MFKIYPSSENGFLNHVSDNNILNEGDLLYYVEFNLIQVNFVFSKFMIWFRDFIKIILRIKILINQISLVEVYTSTMKWYLKIFFINFYCIFP